MSLLLLFTNTSEENPAPPVPEENRGNSVWTPEPDPNTSVWTDQVDSI